MAPYVSELLLPTYLFLQSPRRFQQTAYRQIKVNSSRSLPSPGCGRGNIHCPFIQHLSCARAPRIAAHHQYIILSPICCQAISGKKLPGVKFWTWVAEVCKISFIVSEIMHYSSWGFGLREMTHYFKHRTGLTTCCFTGLYLYRARSKITQFVDTNTCTTIFY
jgi:hypothetical protein